MTGTARTTPSHPSARALQAAARMVRWAGWELWLPEGASPGAAAARFRWSAEAAQLFGWPDHEQTLDEALQQFTPAARAPVRQALERCLGEGAAFDLLAQAQTAGAAQPVAVRLAGQALRAAHAGAAPITGAHGGVQDVHEGEERFQLVARATSDAIWDWDLLGDAMAWNDGAQALFGDAPDALPADGPTWSARLHPQDCDRVLAQLHGAIHDGRTRRWSDEYRFRRHDGTYVWVKDRGFILRDATGAAYRMVGGMTDLSAHKHIEHQALEEARAHALLLQVQQQVTRRDQPLALALEQALQVALALTGAAAAQADVQGSGQEPLRAHAGTAPQPGEAWPPPGFAACLEADGTALGTFTVWPAPGQRLADEHLEHLHILAGSLAALVQLRRVDARLRASERQYRALFAEHAQPMWVCEQGSLRLLAANRAMSRLYGWSEDELLGMDMRALWPPSERGGVQEALARAAQSRAPVLWRHLRKGRTAVDVQAVVGETTFGEHAAWQVLAGDVTERRRLEAELARVGRAKRTRSACSQVLVRATTEEEFLQAICRVAVDVGGYALAWVGMARQDPGKRIDIVAHAGHHPDFVRQLRLTWSHARLEGRGPAGKAVRSGQVVAVRDLARGRGHHPQADKLLGLGLRAVVCLPLKAGDHTFGVLYLYADQVLHAGAEETQLLDAMAADVSFGVHSLRTRAEQQRLQSALLKVASAVSAGTGTQFFDQLAENMAQALDAQVACVARFVSPGAGAPERVVTLSYVAQGEVQPNGEYPLLDTPSHHLLRHRQYVVADRAAELYPRAPILASTAARSYVGQQLTGSDGRPLGVLFVAFTATLEQAQFVVHMLQIFAARATAELERQEADAHIRRQASLLDKARDAILVRDLDGCITYWNHGAEQLYGWRSDEVLGRRVRELLYADPAAFDRAMATVLRDGDWNGELAHRSRDGRTLEVEGRWTLVRDEAGAPEAVLAIHSDIGQRKASEREIQRLAFFDPLTGLPNRMQLLERMGDALVLAEQQGSGGALLFIDLDNFKTLNDTLGHDKGDQLLQIVGQRLRGCVRAPDTVARLGGDEFVVLVQGLSGAEGPRADAARLLGDKVLATLAEPYRLAGYQVRSTPSVGIALYGGSPTSVGELLKQADMAMYEAKMAGRNTLRFFDPAMQHAVAERAQLEADLREGLAHGQFLLMYQPVVDAAGDILGVEALARWAHPQRGMVSPGTFIPLAEETGLILPLGRWVLQTACRQLAAWQHLPGRGHLTVAVNVSSRQFRDVGFVQEVVGVLQETGAPAGQLKLELTESLLVEDMQATIAIMEALRAHGVGFSLDDFGTGYSSLAYLKRMPLAQLKIDQSFVRDLLQDASDAAIVKTIIALAASLDLQAIAEGVETQEQRDWLAAAGCTLYQGYLFARPLPADQLERLLLTTGLPRPHRPA